MVRLFPSNAARPRQGVRKQEQQSQRAARDHPGEDGLAVFNSDQAVRGMSATVDEDVS